MTVVFCRSRNQGRRCTRPLAHTGLHRHRAVMWTEVGADPARCPGSGSLAAAAAPLADGFPGGRAVCPTCQGFFPLGDGRIVQHDAGDDGAPAAKRAEWFNTHGW